MSRDVNKFICVDLLDTWGENLVGKWLEIYAYCLDIFGDIVGFIC